MVKYKKQSSVASIYRAVTRGGMVSKEQHLAPVGVLFALTAQLL